MKKSGILLALLIVLYGASHGLASAYSVSSTSPGGGSAGPGPSLPQPPAVSFTFDWSAFQHFVTTIESLGSRAVTQELQAPQPIAGVTPQNIFQTIDNWTEKNLGFRFSSFFSFTLQLIEWVLAIAKAIIDWLMTLIH